MMPATSAATACASDSCGVVVVAHRADAALRIDQEDRGSVRDVVGRSLRPNMISGFDALNILRAFR